jgi:hypothetical protein
MNTLTQPCAHPECNCQVIAGLEDAAYCSDVCLRMDTTDEDAEATCPCGHPPCDVE